MSVTKVQTIEYELGGFGNKLTRDFAANKTSAQAFLGDGNWRRVLEAIQQKNYPRAELSAVLESSALKYDAPLAALENIRKLKDPQTFVVITGQQAGLLGGPLLTLYKALTTVRLARQLQAESGGKAQFIPVFWVAADDHDWGEIDHAWLLDSERLLRRVRVEASADSLGVSAAKIRLKSDPANGHENSLIEQLLAAGWSADKVDSTTASYAQESVADVFIRNMYKELGHLGLVVAHSGDVRSFGRELLLSELTLYPETTRRIEATAESMRRAGYEPGFVSTQGSKETQGPHFFIETIDGIRAALKWDSAANCFVEHSPAFGIRGVLQQRYTPAELTEIIRASPQRFSAAAALRPILQQTVFPVVAVVLGPGEMSYWAQLKAVHEQFGAIWPMIVPRASATLIDAPIEKIVRKLGLEERISEIFVERESLKATLFSKYETMAALKARRQTILAELEAACREVKLIGSGLDTMLDKIRKRFNHELNRLERGAGHVLLEHESVGERRLEQLLTWIRPRNQPQERVLCCAEMCGRFPQLVDELLEVFDPKVRQHFVVTLG